VTERIRMGWILAVLLLTASAACADRVLIPPGSTWKYLSNGSDQGTAWRQPRFNDAYWPEGPAELGYGDGDEGTLLSYGGVATNKYITYYYRKHFWVDDASRYPAVRVGFVNDDGGVVYLNGREVGRYNMPAGSFSFSTWATGEVSGDAEKIYRPFYQSGGGWFSNGWNVVAAEVHQRAPFSSDTSFDLKLTGVTDPSQPCVIRGPYLQMGTSTGMVVRWRTSTATDSVVRYGISAGALTQQVARTGPFLDHEVSLTGLSASTRYFYSVGTTAGALAGGDADHTCVTPPPLGSDVDRRIWLLGDSGTGNAAAGRVRDAFLQWAGGRRPDLWIMLGDNAYMSGTDAEHQSALFDMYPQTLPQGALWSTMGNHEGYSASSATESGVYYDVFTLPRHAESGGIASGTEAYYSFDDANVHFICLNAFDVDRSTNGLMMTWLRDDVASMTQRWCVAFWHHPPYSKGSHNSDTEIELIEMRQNALPILEAAGVDLVLCGHSHSYERSYLLHGQYGPSSSVLPSNIVDGGDGRVEGSGPYDNGTGTGTVYVVAGSSGQISGGALNHPVMYVSLNALGSVVLDVHSNRMDVTFLGDRPVVKDHFTIVKGGYDRRLTAQTIGPGNISPPGGYYPAGASASVTAVASNYYALGAWGGDLSGRVNPTNLVMTTDRAVTARFDAILVTNQVPQWWLAAHGLPTSDAGATADTDTDRMRNWEEYHAGTDPTESASVFRVDGVARSAGGAVLRWPSVGGQIYSVYRAPDPAGSFTPRVTGVSATPPTNTYTDALSAGEPSGFYRITTQR
jgi:hypothetical protein